MMKIANVASMLGFALLLVGCASTFTDAGKLPVEMRHTLHGDESAVEAVVTNRSDRTVTFVDHPDHCSISVLARDRSTLVFSVPACRQVCLIDRHIGARLET